MLAGESDLACDEGRPALPPGTIASLSAADSSVRDIRTAHGGAPRCCSHAGRCYARAGGRSMHGGATGRSVRGPAPSHNSSGFSASAMSASRLLRDVPSRRGVVAAAILYVRMPSGVTQRAGSGRELSPASSCGVSTAASAIAARVAAAAVMSFAIVPTYSPHEDRTYPPRRRRQRAGSGSPVPPFLPVEGGIGRVRRASLGNRRGEAAGGGGVGRALSPLPPGRCRGRGGDDAVAFELRPVGTCHRMLPERSNRVDRRLQATGGRCSDRVADLERASGRYRRTVGQGGDLRAQPDGATSERVGGSLDRAGPGA
jgi:hypothetical protein